MLDGVVHRVVVEPQFRERVIAIVHEQDRGTRAIDQDVEFCNRAFGSDPVRLGALQHAIDEVIEADLETVRAKHGCESFWLSRRFLVEQHLGVEAVRVNLCLKAEQVDTWSLNPVVHPVGEVSSASVR